MAQGEKQPPPPLSPIERILVNVPRGGKKSKGKRTNYVPPSRSGSVPPWIDKEKEGKGGGPLLTSIFLGKEHRACNMLLMGRLLKTATPMLAVLWVVFGLLTEETKLGPVGGKEGGKGDTT